MIYKISFTIGSKTSSGAISSIDSIEMISFIDEAFGVSMTGVEKAHFQTIDSLTAYIVANKGADVIDCGVPVLSMHAPYEVTSKHDVYMAYKGYGAFFRK